MTETPPMPIKSLAPWYCASRTLAPRIAKEIGRPRLFWNEFCGSLAVNLAMSPCPRETVNDLHGDICNLARVVQREDLAVKLFDRVLRTLMHESIFHECDARFRSHQNAPAPEEPDGDRAYDYLVSSWFGRNGIAGTQPYNRGFCLRFTANGSHAAKRFRSVAESIPAWHDRLRNITVSNRNARDTLPRIDDDETTVVYCDPPYVEKGASYVHDFAPVSPTGKSKKGTSTDLMTHAELAALLKRFRDARVIVSYYDHPLVRELYQGWTFVECPLTKSLNNQGQRARRGGTKRGNAETTRASHETNRGADETGDGGTPKAPEILIINGPSFTSGMLLEAPCG